MTTRRAVVFLALFVVASGVALYSLFDWWPLLKPPPSLVEVEIPRGATASEVAELLAARRIVPTATGLRLALWNENLDRSVQAGRYVFEAPLSAGEAIEVLRRGPASPEEVEVTIPPGLRLDEIAARLDAAYVTDGARFLALARAEGLEGFLYPDTYRFSPGTPAEEVVARLRRRFDEVIAARYEAAAETHGLTLYEAATLASIVEAEAYLDEEKPLIAAVFLRRLALGRRLAADPTVRYALGKFEGPLLSEDLEVESPYNTYRVVGLPPGPICAFDVRAFEAVLAPAETDALYFVAANDGTGRHIFSRTLREHNEARIEARSAARGR